jgi:hypothetical protein
MEIVKKNMFSIVCGVVAIVAIVAWFWPVGGMFDKLQSDVKARAATYDQVDNLRKAKRTLPSLVVEGGEQPVLGFLPNEEVIKAGKAAADKLTAQSKRMLDTVSNMNVRKPLVPRSLPIAESGARASFAARYLAELGAIEQPAPSPEVMGPGLPNFESGLPKRLNATRPPYPEELMEMARKVWDDKYNSRVLAIGQDSNLDQLKDEFYEEVRTLPDRERQDRAKKHSVYLDETSLPVSQEIFALQGKPPTENQIWFAQTALWITEDVVNAVNAANKGAKGIPQSPVKHLMSLRIPFGMAQYVLPTAAPGAPMAGGEAAAAAGTTDANGVTKAYHLYPTGRVSNDVYDVIHFDLVLRVDFRKIPQVIAELERNRLFTVLTTSVQSVDAQAEYKEVGYDYGNDPVAQVTLQCEALFLRSWTVDKDNKERPYKNAVMPQQVRGWVGAEQIAGLPGATPGGMVPGAEMLPEER